MNHHSVVCNFSAQLVAKEWLKYVNSGMVAAYDAL